MREYALTRDESTSVIRSVSGLGVFFSDGDRPGKATRTPKLSIRVKSGDIGGTSPTTL